MLRIPYDDVSAILNHSYPSLTKLFRSEPPEVAELRKFLSDNKNFKTELISNKKTKLVNVEKLLDLVLIHLPTVMVYKEEANPAKQLYVNLYYYLSFSLLKHPLDIEHVLNEVMKTKLVAARVFCRAIDILKLHHLYSPVVRDLYVKYILKDVSNVKLLEANLNTLEDNDAFINPDDIWDYAFLFERDGLLFDILRTHADLDNQNIDQQSRNVHAFSARYHHNPNIWLKSHATGSSGRSIKDITQVLREMLRAGLLTPHNLKKLISIFNISQEATFRDVEKFIKFTNPIYAYLVSHREGSLFTGDAFTGWLQLAEAELIPENFGEYFNVNDQLSTFGRHYPVLKDYLWTIIANRDNILSILDILRYFPQTQVTYTPQILSAILQNRAYLAGNEFFTQVPSHMVTPEVFARLIAICQSQNTPANKRQEIAAYGRHLIGAELPNFVNPNQFQQPVQGMQPRAQDINSRQSTHDKEVHKTVSESVKRLYERYGDKIKTPKQLDQVIESIKKWAQQLPDEPKEPDAKFEEPINIDKVSPEFKAATAKRAILKEKPKIGVLDLNFTDPGSNITMREMFALYWIAAQDFNLLNTERVGGHDYKAADTEKLFISGLYEIQREYCIDKISKEDETEYDFGDADRNSCAGGTFNKMTEKFKSVHPDVEVKISSERILTFKFPIIVREAMLDHLKQKLEGIQDINALNNVKALFEKVIDEGADAIWDEIRVIIHKKMASEFADTFPTPKALEEYVENGMYTELTETQKQAFKKYVETYESKFSNSNDSAPIETPAELPPLKEEPISAPQVEVEPDITFQEAPIKSFEEKEPIPSKSSNAGKSSLKKSNSTFFSPLEAQAREISQSEKLEKIQRMKDVLDYVINDAASRMIEVDEIDRIKKEHGSIIKTAYALLVNLNDKNAGEVNHVYNLTNHIEDHVIGKDLYDQLSFSVPRSKSTGFKK